MDGCGGHSGTVSAVAVPVNGTLRTLDYHHYLPPTTVPAKPLGPPPMTRPVNPDSRRRVTHRQTDLRHDDTIRDRLSSCAADTRINI